MKKNKRRRLLRHAAVLACVAGTTSNNLGVATPVFLVGLARYRRNTRAELERLLELQRHPE